MARPSDGRDNIVTTPGQVESDRRSARLQALDVGIVSCRIWLWLLRFNRVTPNVRLLVELEVAAGKSVTVLQGMGYKGRFEFYDAKDLIVVTDVGRVY